MSSEMSRSGLSRSDLAELLRVLRTVCPLPDTEAIGALDKLLLGLKRDLNSDGQPDELGWQRERAVADLDRLRQTIQRVRSAFIDPGPQLLWQGQSLRQSAEYSGSYLDPQIEASFRPEFLALQKEALDLADEGEIAAFTSALREAATQLIHNASSVRSIISSVDDAATELKKRERWTEDLERLQRFAKERAARFRSQRALDEADVAAAGGNSKKTDKLRREAAVLLTQDWLQAFPGEAPPASLPPTV